MSNKYGWCQSCGALVFNSAQCHKCNGKVKSFFIYTQLVEFQKRIKELEIALEEFGTHKESCAYQKGLRGQSIEDCDCGFEKALKG